MSKVLVVLDAGHGFNANQGVVNDYREGNGNFFACMRFSEELRKYGIDVILTRTNINQDPDISGQRGQTAVRNAAGYDDVVFISWHSDASGNQAVRGVTVFNSMRRRTPKQIELAEKLAATIARAMNTPLSPYGGNVNGVVHKAHPSQAGNDFYAVLRGATGSAAVSYVMLIEHGFHTNVADCTFLDTSARRNELVEAEAKAIAEFFGKTQTAPVSDTKTLRIFSPTGTVVSSQQLHEGVIGVKGADGKLNGYITSGDARMRREYTADTLSQVMADMVNEMQPNELIISI